MSSNLATAPGEVNRVLRRPQGGLFGEGEERAGVGTDRSRSARRTPALLLRNRRPLDEKRSSEPYDLTQTGTTPARQNRPDGPLRIGSRLGDVRDDARTDGTSQDDAAAIAPMNALRIAGSIEPTGSEVNR